MQVIFALVNCQRAGTFREIDLDYPFSFDHQREVKKDATIDFGGGIWKVGKFPKDTVTVCFIVKKRIMIFKDKEKLWECHLIECLILHVPKVLLWWLHQSYFGGHVSLFLVLSLDINLKYNIINLRIREEFFKV